MWDLEDIGTELETAYFEAVVASVQFADHYLKVDEIPDFDDYRARRQRTPQVPPDAS